MRLAATLIAFGLVSLAAPAAATPASLSQIYDAGQCLAWNHRSTAAGLMQSTPFDADLTEVASLPEPARRCLSGATMVDVHHLRGAIAQALFFRDFETIGAEPRRSRALVSYDIPVQDSPAGSPTVELFRLADCLVRNDSPHSEQLMSSPVGSTNQERAIQLLMPFMAACLGNDQLRVSSADLRSAVAQSAYHSMYRYWTRQIAPNRQDP
jgi:hypothetical protein